VAYRNHNKSYSECIFLHTVFGWFQDSFVGIERESAYNLSVGYIKGAEQAGARLMLNVVTNFGTARKHPHFTRD
jgi:hypothetical protein